MVVTITGRKSCSIIIIIIIIILASTPWTIKGLICFFLVLNLNIFHFWKIFRKSHKSPRNFHEHIHKSFPHAPDFMTKRKNKNFLYYLRSENLQFCVGFDIKLVDWPWSWCATYRLLGIFMLQRWRPVHGGTSPTVQLQTPSNAPRALLSEGADVQILPVHRYPCIAPQHPRD